MSKVALVTGASSGIGKATAHRLLDEGYIVYCGARRISYMEDLKRRGGIVIFLDVTDEKCCKNVVNLLLKNEGRIDVLVNDAGYGYFGSMEESSVDIGKGMFEVNLFGLVRMMQLVVPTMRLQGSGSIVNLSSIGGKMTTPFSGWYMATKHAIESVSDAARMELKDFGVNVIIIEPGIIKTEFYGIAADALEKLSLRGPYSRSVKKMLKKIDKNYIKGSESCVVADAIFNAISSQRPKVKYAVGYRGKSTILEKRFLPDKIFDKVVMVQTMVKNRNKKS